tara:strand:- start:146 stop:1129 length:984 start_codon:yes stop_codon:yes gene_type:complete
LHTEPPKTFNNYLVSINYLEYASFLLSDIEYFLLYSDISTKASRFSNIEKRFQVIQNLILRSSDNFLSKNNYFDRPFKLHFEYLNWFYDYTLKEFNNSFKTTDDCGSLDHETLQSIEVSASFFDAFQAFLPINHNDFFIYESAKLSSRAFTDCFNIGENVLSANNELSMEMTSSALDMLEMAYLSVEQEPYRRQEYDALKISMNVIQQNLISFKHFQDLKRIYIASCYQENVLLKQLFLVSSLSKDESISEETLGNIFKVMDSISEKIPEFAAIRNESALKMISSNLTISGQEFDDLKMFFPSKECASILESNVFNYLDNLPPKVIH